MLGDLPFRAVDPASFGGFSNDNLRPASEAVPAGAAGLVLCCERDRSDRPIATIRPLLKDGSLGEPLQVEPDDSEIIALWRGLGRAINRPLFVLGRDGQIVSLATGRVSFHPARRSGSALKRRRTRFSRRRMTPHGNDRHLLAAGQRDRRAADSSDPV